ncbi:hypothetical protein L1N85_13820 [Paenibacillus alkaliterrae]|uniref:hypothetical protein n=1 Tax=Paenibacillus alkaliterrae TaxID=320909 RepID=UPI001F4094F0|nr:hypothetical protein [Paenibacillus alkaliterrae]MCF2939498.1 hypothetical protein [Paenibacillus alkaliterrae]
MYNTVFLLRDFANYGIVIPVPVLTAYKVRLDPANIVGPFLHQEWINSRSKVRVNISIAPVLRKNDDST